MNKLFYFLLFIVSLLFSSCQKNSTPLEQPKASLKDKLLEAIENPPNYVNPNYPTHFVTALNTDNNPTDNP